MAGEYNWSMDETEPKEASLSSGVAPTKPFKTNLTLERAIELGEYDPQYLAGFPEWHTYTRHIQFEFIKKALANRRKQLLLQWMEINRANDYLLKPHLQKTSESIDAQLDKLLKDKEKLYTEYSLG